MPTSRSGLAVVIPAEALPKRLQHLPAGVPEERDSDGDGIADLHRSPSSTIPDRSAAVSARPRNAASVIAG